MKKNPIIALTVGDPGGIGPEVLVKALRLFKVRKSAAAFLILGSPEIFDTLQKKTGLRFQPKPVLSLRPLKLKAGSVYLYDISKRALELLREKDPKASPETLSRFQIGKLSKVNAALTLASLETAADLAVKGTVQAMVNAPLNKAAVRLLQPCFIGHTEYLAHRSGVRDFAMFFYSPQLKVTLITIHLPLKEVSSHLSQKQIETKIRLTENFLRRSEKIARPRIAVAALNPHGRECGEEEDRIIVPAVRKLQKERLNVTGPFSADQLFYEAYRGKYDAVICMYHDQGLGPFKMMAFHDGVNVTLGLPFVRTSTDHGTAFDIAYSNQARPSSMIAALRLTEKAVTPRKASSC